MLKRQHVIGVIEDVFQAHGFEPIYTPVMELYHTLFGQYGEDAEKLIYSAQHSGSKDEGEFALRYDLTVPLARFFAMHEAALSVPFRRYHIAPVWRGERPGRGRFREFFQCDADIVGVAGMEADSEIIGMAAIALQRLGFDDFVVNVNNRKLLTGIGQFAGLSGEPLAHLYRSIDKFDKIGESGVRDEMLKSGIDPEIVARIVNLLVGIEPQPGYEAGEALIERLRGTLSAYPSAASALDELATLFEYLRAMGIPGARIAFDPLVVRGLGYYTGNILEAVLRSDDPEERVGSVAGGGRYDDLIGRFRERGSLPTVGLALGLERLITIMDKRQLYPEHIQKTVVEVLVTVFGPETRLQAMRVAAELREAGHRVELFMQEAKIGNQIKYADRRGIPVVLLLGPDEAAQNMVKLKRLADQREVAVGRGEAASTLRDLLRYQTPHPA
jgi:histidyl-tRNA synthetase